MLQANSDLNTLLDSMQCNSSGKPFQESYAIVSHNTQFYLKGLN